ncbi:hypothetical protein AVEN_83154-1 [Araneus ventricosus]|uniref:Tudor domain-containing protein n=1 Tax=Araneus ventricosus TaxID=182803 RepID=A0A4Y2AMH2_ARAVE|nr:hypothetical protein AVEN_83154-1 [Araneus ventricosus]
MLTSYNAQNSPIATSNNSDAIATSNNLQHNSNQQHSNMQILDSVEDGAPTVISSTFADILSSKDFLDLVAVREQAIEKEAALKPQQIAAKGKKTCVIKNKNLEEADEPPAKRALLSNTSNEELKEPSGNIEQLKKNTTLEQAKILLANIHDTLKEQVYFAVYYDNDPFYIGKVTKVIDEQNVKMEFLEKGAGNFRWSKRDKLEIINVKYIFYGPVILLSSNPFDVDNAVINMAYKCYKRFCQELWL